MHKPRHRYGIMAFLVLTSAGTGCQSEQPYGVVEGTVTLDGKPIKDVEVVFMPDPERGTTGRRSVALVDAEGRFRVFSDEGRQGAPVGFHRVCINDRLAGPPGSAPAAPRVVTPEDNPKGLAGAFAPPPEPPQSGRKKSRFPDAYSAAHETPFRGIEVQAGGQVINLEMKRALTR